MAFATTLAGITSKYRDARSLFHAGCLRIPINSEQLRRGLTDPLAGGASGDRIPGIPVYLD